MGREGGGRVEGGEGKSDVVSGRERKKYRNNRNEEGMEGGRYRIWTNREAGSSMHIQSIFTISVNIRC